MDSFTRQYIATALWSSTDESTPQGGEPLDRNYSESDLAPSALRAMTTDCERFQATYWDDIAHRTEDAGHDFWLTRNGHGAGFWDGDWPEDVGARLTAAAKSFGECDLYVGDDGLIYVYGRES